MPRVAKLASSTEYVKLINRLVDSNMVDFTTTPPVVNRVFTVPKPDGAQRLIVDGRPAQPTVFSLNHLVWLFQHPISFLA